MPLSLRRGAVAAIASLALSPALADLVRPATTVELVGHRSDLDAGQPDGHGLNLRLTWDRPSGDVIRAELLDETKFGMRGGVVGIGWAHVPNADWIVAGTLLLGRGGVNWPDRRIDLEVTRKWLADRSLLSRVGIYHATYEGNRSDRGARLSLVAYLPASFVVEGGVLANVSDPGGVHSSQRFASVTWGSAGSSYLAARYSTGSEAYQAIGGGRQLVDFDSHSFGVSWRRWLGRDWGVIVQAEHYRNPSYERETVGAGLFAQW